MKDKPYPEAPALRGFANGCNSVCRVTPNQMGDSFGPRIISSMCGSVRDLTQGLIYETLPTALPGVAI